MKKKILLVEDDQMFANIYRNKLLLDGFKVEVAEDGEIGFEMVKSFQPDAILLDLILPKMPGVELLKKIRSDPSFAHLPIIVFTNTYLTSMVQDAWKAGATKCLTKANSSPNQVIGTIRSVLEGNGKITSPGAAAPRKAQTVEPPATADDDKEFQAQLRKTFLETLPPSLAALRVSLQGAIKAENDAGRVKQLQEMHRRVHAITGNAGLAGMSQMANMADALEALIKELYEKPANINASTLRTVASAIDFMAVLLDQRTLAAQPNLAPSIMVVDDEPISRRAIIYALEKAKLKSVNVDDPLTAIQLLAEKRYDLIFLDVDMPNMSGFELCTKIRTLPAYKKVPIVFVTSLNDFESRANSTMSGGNDFIAKPFLFIELAVKALVYVLRGKIPAPA